MSNKGLKAKLEYYLSLNYPMVITEDVEEEIYVVEFLDLPGCIAHGNTPTSAVKLANEVKKEWIETALSLNRYVPIPKDEEEYSGRFSLRLTKELHKRLSEQAKLANISLNQHSFIMLSERSRELDHISQVKRLEAKIDDLARDVKRMVSQVDTLSTKKVYILDETVFTTPTALEYKVAVAESDDPNLLQ